MIPYELREGDKVQFGVATSPSVPPEFVYQYYTAMKVKHARTRPSDQTDGEHGSSTPPRVKRLKTKDVQVRAKC